MKYEISKELFEAVMNKEVSVKFEEVISNIIAYYSYSFNDNWEFTRKTISVYEFFFMCKEFAYKQGYRLSVHTSDDGSTVVEIMCGWSVTDFHHNFEPQAVFNATSWIVNELKSKEKQ